LFSDYNEKRQYISVTQLNEYIKSLLDSNALLSNLCVKGEISNFTNHRSGHFYFSIKDEGSLIRAVMFKSAASRLKFMPENGMKILARGSVSLFVRDGQYQLYVTQMEPDGLGSLYLAFEQLKEKLSKKGLFDENRKKLLPKIPSKIGVITSPTGAAVRDIMNILKRRYPFADVTLYPALVQGPSAPAQLIQGLRYFNENPVDVIIIGRGGGSIEDLWAFNDENLAYAIYDSDIPVISAVGHETDFTICDFVSDKRAPTPSAAAELATPDINELLYLLMSYRSRLSGVILKDIQRKREKLSLLSERKVFSDPEYYLQEKRLLTAFLFDKISRLIQSRLNESESELQKIAGKLDAMSPLSTLSRGYAIGYNLTKNTPICSIDDVIAGDEIKMKLKDGSVFSTVKEKTKEKEA
jgi:exodeoxyribonuclease VII large subunit